MRGNKGIRCCIRGVLWGLIPLLFILLLAWFVARPGMESDLRSAALERLKAAGQDWAGMEMEGRDARLTGQAPSRTGLVDAARNVRSVYGIRRVSVADVAIRLAPPTVDPVAVSRAPLTITGTWPEDSGAGLEVEVMGRTYALGRSPELKSDGRGKWTLTLESLPPDGVHDVVAMTVDGERRASDTTTNELVVDTTPPADPTIGRAKIGGQKVRLGGTWPEGDAKTLSVSVGDRVFELGRDRELRSDGKGNWTLDLGRMLPEGTYDVAVTVTDAVGNTAVVRKKGLLAIDFTPPAEPAITHAAFDGGRIVVEGVWPRADARRLIVSVGGKNYELGRDRELVADDRGRWRLTLDKRLPDGRYDVTVTAVDAAGNRSQAVGRGILLVDTKAPAIGDLTTVEVGEDGKVRIRGTWKPEDGAVLRARLGGRTYVLGRTEAFVSDGKGHWTLEPEEPFGPGRYDLVLDSEDASGNRAHREFTAAVVVAAPKAEEPEREEAERKKETEEGDASTPPADTTPPAAPTVVAMKTRQRQPRITGSWPADDAVSLEVEVGGRKYRKGFGEALEVDGGTWTLVPDEPLPDGTYDVKVTVKDAAGNAATDSSRNELVVDATSPKPPTVEPLATLEGGRVTIRGTWPEGDAKSLTVEVGGRTYVLGAGGSLRKEGPGRWVLDLPDRLAPGAHDVKATAVDELGNVSTDQTVNEIVVKPQPKVVQPEETGDKLKKSDLACQKNLDAVLGRATIHFESDSERIRPESMKLLEEVARILNTCPKTRVLVAGHTDATGSATYNQSLSERRAAAVGRALVKLGVSASRFSAVGYGESRPVADNDTEEGRAKNRRIEFIITPVEE